MEINKELVKNIEELSKLTLTDEEREMSRTDIQSVVEYLEFLTSANAEGSEDFSPLFYENSRLREDNAVSDTEFKKSEFKKSKDRKITLEINQD